MRKRPRLLVTAVASICAGLAVPLAALENVEIPPALGTLAPGTITPCTPAPGAMAPGVGFGASDAVALGTARHRPDAWALVIADPLAMPLIIVGVLALVAAINLRRRRRRRMAWAYIQTAALPQRMFAKRR